MHHLNFQSPRFLCDSFSLPKCDNLPDFRLYMTSCGFLVGAADYPQRWMDEVGCIWLASRECAVGHEEWAVGVLC